MIIMKGHHSLGDGMSWISFMMQTDRENDKVNYDVKKIINFPDISLWKRTLLRLMIPISILSIIKIFLSFKPVKNGLRDVKNEKLTGKKHCVYSDKISFDEVK